MIVSSLQLTSRYLLLKHGLDHFNGLLRDFWKNSVTKLFASDNGLDFAEYLSNNASLNDADLDAVLRYEMASIHAYLEKESVEVELPYHPMEMADCLANLQLFDQLMPGEYLITIEPDSEKLEEVKTVFH
jgi:hypothetical protein